MTFSIMTLSVMTFSIMTFNIMTFNIMTFSKTTLSSYDTSRGSLTQTLNFRLMSERGLQKTIGS